MYQFTKKELEALLFQVTMRYREHYIFGPTEGSSSLASRKAIIDVMDQAEDYYIDEGYTGEIVYAPGLTEEELAEVPF